MTAGEDWLRSSIVVNATRTMQQRRKGRFVMTEYRALKTRFGAGLAKTILQEKKELQEKKDPSDPVTYWMKHPDTPQEAGGWDRLLRCQTPSVLSVSNKLP